MIRPILISAVLTGLFCGAFAFGIHWLTHMLDRTSVVVVSFVSGFLGSLFATFVMRRRSETLPPRERQK